MVCLFMIRVILLLIIILFFANIFIHRYFIHVVVQNVQNSNEKFVLLNSKYNILEQYQRKWCGSTCIMYLYLA